MKPVYPTRSAWTLRSGALFALLAVGSLSGAQDWAKARVEKSPRHLEWVKIDAGSRKVSSLVAYPEVKDKAPVVIVIHEIFGHTDWIIDVADRLAEAGYIAIAPDLLSGMAPGGGRTTDFKDSGALREAISGLPPDQITADLKAVAAYGKLLPSSNGKTAVMGFCWGGGQSFRFATNQADLSAALVFYGPPPAKEALANITAPVYGFYGGNDNRINATIPETEAAMKELKKTFEPVVYEGAGHGFLRAGEAPDANEGNKKGFEAGWKRVFEVLKKVFG
ncbi:MAG: dienelactone hydrolase family protein [Armatimonadetes bacterium]|nr:dienelactone hydrolase family protein [Armatimonadota bacterium]